MNTMMKIKVKTRKVTRIRINAGTAILGFSKEKSHFLKMAFCFEMQVFWKKLFSCGNRPRHIEKGFDGYGEILGFYNEANFFSLTGNECNSLAIDSQAKWRSKLFWCNANFAEHFATLSVNSFGYFSFTSSNSIGINTCADTSMNPIFEKSFPD